jgi:hypothetical protein
MAKVTLTIKSDAMKSYLPLLTFVILLTSCSSVYRSGQTPDDVYFSPERPREEYVRVDNRNDRSDRRYQLTDEEAREDRYLRMKARNRRYSFLEDDYDYFAYNGNNYYRYNDYYRMNAFRYNPNWMTWNYRFGGMYNYDPFFYNPFYFNPYHHSPYYSGVVYGNVSPRFNRPRTANLNTFDRDGNPNNNGSRNNSRTFSVGSDRRNESYRGSNTNAGGFMRNVFGGENSNSGSNKTPSASSNSGNSGSSGSSGSSSSGSSRAPVRRF